MARAGSYDLILMDMQMPVMDGLDATVAVRRLPGYAETPIIALTANAFTEDRDRCLDAGMDDFVSKPIRPDVLLAVLTKWLSKDGAGAARRTIRSSLARTQPSVAPAPLVVKELLGNVDGDRDQAKRLIEIFRESFGTATADLDQFIDLDRLVQAERLAHAIKGAAGVLAAHEVHQASGNVEAALRSLRPLVRTMKGALDAAFAMTADLDVFPDVSAHDSLDGITTPETVAYASGAGSARNAGTTESLLMALRGIVSQGHPEPDKPG